MPFEANTPVLDDSDSSQTDDGVVHLKIHYPKGILDINMYQSELDTISVRAFKEILSPKLDWPVDRIILSHIGKTLNDSSQLSSFGISEGSKIVASRELGENVANSNDQKKASGSSHPKDDPVLSLLCSIGGSGGSHSPFPGSPPNQGVGLVKSVFDNQVIGSTLQNSEFIRSLLANNSRINRMVEQNQDLMQVLNENELLDQIFDTIRNPKLIKEVMRNNDRQLSNVESLPGGLNILSKLYQSLQDASSFVTLDKSTDSLNSEFARNLGVKERQSNEINDEPLPNPWIPRKPQEYKDIESMPSGLFRLKDDPHPLLSPSDSLMFPPKHYFEKGQIPEAANSFLGMIQLLADIPSPVDFQRASSPELKYNSNDPQSSAGHSSSMMMRNSEASSSVITNPPDTASESQQSPSKDSQKFEALSSILTSDTEPSPHSTEDPQINTHSSQLQQQPPQADASAEERYAFEIRLLMEMGFSKKEDCISALLAAGGSIEGALDYLKCITSPHPDRKN